MTDTLGSAAGFSQLFLSGKTPRVSQMTHVTLADGKNNSYVGMGSGNKFPQAGGNNAFFGFAAGAMATANSTVFVGSYAGANAVSVTDSAFIGYRAGEFASRVAESTVVGTYAGRKMQRSNCNTIVGYQAGAELVSGSRNAVVGSYAAFQQYAASDNVVVGHRAGYTNKLGSNNVYLGTNSGFAAYAGFENVVVGARAGERLFQGTKNVLAGYLTGAAIANASNCVALGTQAMEFFSEGDTNIVIGTQTARYFTGTQNTILGGYSTANAAGNFNTVIGSRSMNRPTKERVNLSNCVIVGENVQFDIPIITVHANVAAFDIAPPGNFDPTVMTFTEASTHAYLEINYVPVGDPMIIRERYVALGNVASPVVLDTRDPGDYVFRWGSAPSQFATVLPPIPVEVAVKTVELFPGSRLTTVQVTSYGQGLDASVHFENIDAMDLAIEQIFDDPPAIHLDAREHGSTSTEWISRSYNPHLPGERVNIEPVPQIVGNVVTMTATEDISHLVPSMAIQVTDSLVSEINGVWRLSGVTATTFSFPIASAPKFTTTPSVGGNCHVLTSHVVDTTGTIVSGTVVDGNFRTTIQDFAGALFDTPYLPTTQACVNGTLVRDVRVIDKYAGQFELVGVAAPPETIAIGSLEPLIVGMTIDVTGGGAKSIANFDAVFTQRSDKGLESSTIVGPSATDGHTHRGYGTLAQLDANIGNNELTFVAGGTSYADYAVGTQSSNVSLTATFGITPPIPSTFGVQWLDTFSLECSSASGYLDAALVYINAARSVVSNVTHTMVLSPSAIYVESDLPDAEFPVSLANVTDITVTVQHNVRGRTMRLKIAAGQNAVVLEYPTQTLQLYPVNTSSTRASIFGTSCLCTYARIHTVNYNLYPTFSDCIFLGSNFTVGGSILQEKSNVFVAAIGNQPLFTGNTAEFKFFSNAVVVENLVSNQIHIANIHAANIDTVEAYVEAATIEAATIRTTANIVGTANIATLEAHVAVLDDLEATAATVFSANIGLATIDTAHVANAKIVLANIDDATLETARVANANIVSAHIDDASLSNLVVVSGNVEDLVVVHANISGSAGTCELEANDLYRGNLKIGGVRVGGYDGIRFPESELAVLCRRLGTATDAGFFDNSSQEWAMQVHNGEIRADAANVQDVRVGTLVSTGNVVAEELRVVSGATQGTIVANDAYYGTLKVGGTQVGGYDGIRFDTSEMGLIFRRTGGTAVTAGFYDSEYNQWRLKLESDSMYVQGNMVAYWSPSDRTLKTNFRPFDAMQLVKKMPAYRFEWFATGKTDVGCIAQDVAEVFPDAVRQVDKYLAVDYAKLVPVLIGAIGDLERRLAVLEKKTYA